MPFSRSSTSHTQPFTPIWANEKWKNLVHGNDLLQCLDMNGARRLGDWISGARAAKKDRRDSSTAAAIESFIGQGGSTSRRHAIQSIPGGSRFNGAVTPKSTSAAATSPGATTASGTGVGTGGPSAGQHAAPEGFWEPEMPPYEDRSTKSDPASLSDDATGIGAVDDQHPGPNTITIKLIHPGRVTLEMTKSTMPIYHIPKAGAKTRVTTHTFAIITTVPRSALITDTVGNNGVGYADQAAAGMMDIPQVVEPVETETETEQEREEAMNLVPRKTILPNPSSPIRAISKSLPKAASLETPTEEPMAQADSAFQPGRPLIFNRDGTVSRQQSAFPAGATEGGRSLDVSVLLETTNWANTSLGPRDQWPQSLKSAGKSCPLPFHETPLFRTCTLTVLSVAGHAVPASMLSLVGQGPDPHLQCAIQ